jgi:hypothetical protein
VNKVAALAHLLHCGEAIELWETIAAEPVAAANRAAMLEQTVGVSASKLVPYGKLISLYHRIKSDFENTFTAEYIGSLEAFNEVHTLNPSVAIFKDAEELKSLHTKMVNLHDSLISRLDCSGSNRAVGTTERRKECWDNFIGTMTDFRLLFVICNNNSS